MGFRTPLQTIEALEAAGVTKAKLSMDVVLILGTIAGAHAVCPPRVRSQKPFAHSGGVVRARFAAGIWLSFGGYFSIIVGFNPGLISAGTSLHAEKNVAQPTAPESAPPH